MNDYRDKGTFWLMGHSHEVALKLSDGNPVAAVAILTLLERTSGARAFGHMFIELSPEEWDKLYHMCDEDPAKLCSNVIAMNEIHHHNDGENIIRKNLRFAKPALFTEEIIPEDPLWLFKDQKERWKFQRECIDKFMSRYTTAKRSQPR